MIELVTASKLPTLLDALRERVQLQGTLAEFFSQQPVILVQNEGMRQWLKLQLSQSLGNFARINVQFPRTAIFDLQCKSLDVELPFNHKWPLLHRIAILLEELKDHDEMKEATKQWFDSTNEQLSERQRWYFAQLIYDTFDEYELYRWQQVDQWRAEANDWQKYLMKHVYDDAINGFRFRSMHQSLKAINNHTDILAPEYHFFGFSSMVPSQLEWVKVIGKYRPTYLYLVEDVVSTSKMKNTDKVNTSWNLGTYLNEQKQEFKDLIDQTFGDLDSKSFTKSCVESVSEPIEHELQLLQQKLLSQDLDNPTATLIKQEEHIHFASTHNRLREVEILADWLNQKLYEQQAIGKDESSHIKANDILIVSPNISAYRSHLESIFDKEHSPYPIHFDLQLPRNSGNNSLNEALEHGLNLLSSRCKSTEILDWLSFKAIKDYLNIQDEELERIRVWLKNSGIRWGLDSAHRSSFDLPPTQTNSWQFGLQRLILGLTAGKMDELYHGIDALDELQQQDEIELLGKLSFVVHHLQEHLAKVNGQKTMHEWLKWLESYFEPVIAKNDLLKRLRSLDNEFGAHLENDLGSFSEAQGKMSYPVFKTIITNELRSNKSGVARQSGRMLCSDMLPMRNIPFKVIAILGLNDGEFPRTETRAAFSYLNYSDQHKAGDRSRKLEDRALLKEYLLAADDYLFIGYQGKNAFTNEKLPPSPLLAQLIHEVEQIRKVTQSKHSSVVKEYPMQAHSQQYEAFELNSTNHVSAKKFLTTAHQRLKKEKNSDFWAYLFDVQAELDSSIELTIEEVAKRLSDPIQAFVKDRLGIQLREQEYFDESDEPFKLNTLENHQLLDSLLRQKISIDELKPENLLAKGICGDPFHAWDVQSKMLESLKNYDSAWDEKVAELDIDIDNLLNVEQTIAINERVTIRIKLELIDGWVCIRSASKNTYKHRLPKIIMNVFLSKWLPDRYKGLILLMNDEAKKNAPVFTAHKVNGRKEKVAQLVQWLLMSYSKAVPFHTLAADACIYEGNQNRDPDINFDLEKIIKKVEEENFKDDLTTVILNPTILEWWATDTSQNSFIELAKFFFQLEYHHA